MTTRYAPPWGPSHDGAISLVSSSDHSSRWFAAFGAEVATDLAPLRFQFAPIAVPPPVPLAVPVGYPTDGEQVAHHEVSPGGMLVVLQIQEAWPATSEISDPLRAPAEENTGPGLQPFAFGQSVGLYWHDGLMTDFQTAPAVDTSWLTL